MIAAFLLPICFIVGIILIVLVVKNVHSENFSQVVKIVYMYAVIGVTLLLSIVGGILTWNNIVDLALPASSESQIYSLRALFPSLAALGIGLSVFIYHSKKVRKN